MTEQEKFKAWFDKRKTEGMRNFDMSINWQHVAEHFGATLSYEFPYTPSTPKIEWAEGTDMDEVHEYIYKGINEFIEASEDPTRSRAISSDVDEWGSVVDEGHPDYMTLEKKLEHVKLCRQLITTNSDGDFIRSAYELEVVGRGMIEPHPSIDYVELRERLDKRLERKKEAGEFVG